MTTKDQFPFCYVASFKIDNMMSRQEGHSIIENLAKVLEDTMTFQNFEVKHPAESGYVNAFYVPQSLSLHFTLDAPISLIEQSQLLDSWQKIMQAAKKLPAGKSLLEIPVSAREKIDIDFKQINQLVISDSQMKAVDLELQKILNKLRSQSTTAAIRTHAENEMSDLTQRKKFWTSSFASSSNQKATQKPTSLQDLIGVVDQYKGLVGKEGWYSWQLPQLSDLHLLTEETHFFVDKVQSVMQELVEGYSFQADNKNMVEYDISLPCQQFQKEWHQLFSNSLNPQLIQFIHQEAQESGQVWSELISLPVEKGTQLEIKLMQESIKRLRNLSWVTKKSQDKLLVYVDDEKQRWIGAKWMNQPLSSMISLPYSLCIPLEGIYQLRKNKCDPSTEEHLRSIQESAQTEFASYFQQYRS